MTDRRASIRNLLDRAGRGVLNVSEAELLRQQVEAEQRAADHIEAALARMRDRKEVADVHAERAEHERDRLREQIHEERERMRASFREQDAENARLRERAEKAERAANLLADSHRRAEQAEAELQRLRTESPWLRATAEDLATAQAAIARVRALHTGWLSTGAPPLGTSIARWWDKRLIELAATLDEPSDGAGADLPADTARHCGGTLTHPGHKFMRLDVVFNCPGNTPKDPS